MRRLFMMMPLVIATPLVIGIASAQTMTEVGATAAGSAIGSAAGKKTSDGITAIFGKVDTSTKKAAKSDDTKKEPLLDVGEGTPKLAGSGVVIVGGESVPPPPASPLAPIEPRWLSQSVTHAGNSASSSPASATCTCRHGGRS